MTRLRSAARSAVGLRLLFLIGLSIPLHHPLAAHCLPRKEPVPKTPQRDRRSASGCGESVPLSASGVEWTDARIEQAELQKVELPLQESIRPGAGWRSR